MPPLPIEYHPDAVSEAAAARSWYAKVAPRLGVAFADELAWATDQIAAAPNRWTQHRHGTRIVMFRHFPYVVIYRHHDNRVQIIAVHHAKRRPDYWRIRIRD